MSDLEKILSYARNKLGPDRPIYLRWEGAGDCRHPLHILNQLKYQKYGNGLPNIRFRATINIFEDRGSDIYQAALDALSTSMPRNSRFWSHQRWFLRGGVDVTREPGVIRQAKAHVIFVRNIMPTNEQGSSLTRASDTLNDIHTKAIIRRRNSIRNNGALRIGMSGEPGLKEGSWEERDDRAIDDLFTNGVELTRTALREGYKPAFSRDTVGSAIKDRAFVMKNNGSDVYEKAKSVYYLTYINAPT